MNDGIIYAVAGDDQMGKLVMSIKSLCMVSSLPVFVYAHISNDSSKILDDMGIPNKVVDFSDIGNMVEISRYLKTSVHKVTPFDRTAYFDNDIVVVQDPSWIFDEIPESGIIFGMDAGKTVSKFDKYATPGKKLSSEIRRVFGVYVDDSWNIWNGGLFVFNEAGYDFLDKWHSKQNKVIDGIRGWTKRDQGTLIATVWEKGIQNQECLPPEANFLHGLHRGLKHDGSKWINRKTGKPITNIHLCLAWGKKSSDTWVRLDNYINKGTSQLRPKLEKSLNLIVDCIESSYSVNHVSIEEHEKITRGNKHAAVFNINGKIIIIDYHDLVNANKGVLSDIKKAGARPDLVLKCQYRSGHDSYDSYLCNIVPFTYVGVDTHGNDDYIDKFREMFLNNSESMKFAYLLFGRLASHKARKPLIRIAESIGNCDVRLIGMNKGNHHSAKRDGRMDKDQYFTNMACSMFAVDGPGGGNITHRMIEAWAMSQPVICPRLKNSFYEPVEPGVHYIEVEPDYSDLPDKIEYWSSNYEEAMKIASNGYEYYHRYCSRTGIAELFSRIICEHLGVRL